MRLSLFFYIFSGIWILVFSYVSHRVLKLFKLKGWKKTFAWSGVVLISAFVLGFTWFYRTASIKPSQPWIKPLLWAHYSFSGFILLMFFSLILFEIAQRVLWLFKRSYLQERREFLANFTGIGALALSTGFGGIGYVQARSFPRVRRVAVPMANLPQDLIDLQIVQITDLHIGATLDKDFLEKVVATVNALNPDIVAVTGDAIDGYVENLSSQIQAFSQLKAKYGVFFVTGNHEYYWDATAWCQEFRRLGLRVLNNEHEILKIGKTQICLGGVTDYRADRFNPDEKSSPMKAIAGVPKLDLRILLAHQPKSCFEAKEAGFDLQISGHTHGGQFWPVRLIAWLVHPYLDGLHLHEGEMWIYVSPGTGYWGPPLRLGVPSEITQIVLVSAV